MNHPSRNHRIVEKPSTGNEEIDKAAAVDSSLPENDIDNTMTKADEARAHQDEQQDTLKNGIAVPKIANGLDETLVPHNDIPFNFSFDESTFLAQAMLRDMQNLRIWDFIDTCNDKESHCLMAVARGKKMHLCNNDRCPAGCVSVCYRIKQEGGRQDEERHRKKITMYLGMRVAKAGK
ncbi:hypothetical protein N0V88_005045 [Collariella sp. IMI 366227]|nr:hypothetical protein N0V88_005045 [Collariella sp. IMI 366227]